MKNSTNVVTRTEERDPVPPYAAICLNYIDSTRDNEKRPSWRRDIPEN